MIPGIDLAGVVETSSHPEFKPGDMVVLNGYGLSENHYRRLRRICSRERRLARAIA